jgi:hypothetical protein
MSRRSNPARQRGFSGGGVLGTPTFLGFFSPLREKRNVVDKQEGNDGGRPATPLGQPIYYKSLWNISYFYYQTTPPSPSSLISGVSSQGGDHRRCASKSKENGDGAENGEVDLTTVSGVSSG